MTDWMPPLIIAREAFVGDAVAAKQAHGPLGDDLFDQLQLPQTSPLPAQAWVLERQWQNDAAPPLLTLIRPDGVKLTIELGSGKSLHRANEAGKGIQPLARALGLAAFRKRHGKAASIIDATGGLGQDSWALATLGVSVTVIERHPIVHALLANALARARHDAGSSETATRITLLHDQAESLLAEMTAHAIYLDPMYPERRRKKAGSRKGMQFLHALLGPADTHGTEALLPTALSSCVNRIVVKRPRGAERLAGAEHWKGQQTTVESPNTRYDVYHLHTR